MTYELTARDIHEAFQQAQKEALPGSVVSWFVTWDLTSAAYERMAALLNEKQQPQDFSMLIDAARDAVLRRYQAQEIDFTTYEQVAGSLSNARTALLLALRQPTQGVLGEEETV